MEYIKRTMEDKLVKSLDNAKAVFILGPRQVGKTTLIKRLMEVVGVDNSIYYDLDIQSNLDIFTSTLESILARLRFDKKTQGRAYVFFDEIQNISDFSKIIKALVDHHSKEFKLVLTGSSSALIKNQFKESLAGRKEVHILYPLSFTEFCRFKREEKIASLLESGYKHEENNPLHKMKNKMKNLQAEYMVYGGYPEVILKENEIAKAELLNELVSSFVIKDIKHLFRIEKTDELNKLIMNLAINTGKEINLHNLSKETGLNHETVQKYLMVLEASYIISRITPFYTDKNKELVKTPKVYFVDTGIRNKLITNLNPPESREDKGELFENYVFLNLLHKKDVLTEIKFWKTKYQQEIDFIVIRNRKITAYEVKFGFETSNHFTAFKKSYKNADCYFVRYGYQFKPSELPGFF